MEFSPSRWLHDIQSSFVLITSLTAFLLSAYTLSWLSSSYLPSVRIDDNAPFLFWTAAIVAISVAFFFSSNQIRWHETIWVQITAEDTRRILRQEYPQFSKSKLLLLKRSQAGRKYKVSLICCRMRGLAEGHKMISRKGSFITSQV